MGCRIQINAGELPGLLGGQLKTHSTQPDKRRACRSDRNGRPQSSGRPVCIDGGRSLMAAKDTAAEYAARLLYKNAAHILDNTDMEDIE